MISYGEVKDYLHPKVMDGTLTPELSNEIGEAIENRMHKDDPRLTIYDLT